MNNRGFTTISLLIFAPLLFTLFFSGFWMLWFINKKHKMENLCHYYLLQAQDEIVQTNRWIVKLNPRSTMLRLQKRRIDRAIRIAKHPAVIAALMAARLFVVSQQQILAAKQTLYFQKGKVLSQAKLYQYRFLFKKELEDWARFWRAPRRPSYNLQFHFRGSQLKRRSHGIAPNYIRKLQHNYNQRIKAKWSVSLADFLPRELKRWIPVKRRWHGECASHPHKGVHLWKSHTGEGNH